MAGYPPISDEDLVLLALTIAFSELTDSIFDDTKIFTRSDSFLESLEFPADYVDWDIVILELEKAMGKHNYDSARLATCLTIGEMVDYVLTFFPPKKSSRKISKSKTRKKKETTVNLNEHFDAEHYLGTILQEIGTRNELKFYSRFVREEVLKWQLPLKLSDKFEGSIQFVLDEEGIEISLVLPEVFAWFLPFVIVRIVGPEQRSCVFLENDGSAYFDLEGEGPYEVRLTLDLEAPVYYDSLKT